MCASHGKIPTTRSTGLIMLGVLLLMLGAYSPGSYETLQLVDANHQPVPPSKENREGTVVNMINATSTLEQASQEFP